MMVASTATRYCPACDAFIEGLFSPGPGGRPDASCPKCGSLERHRFLAILLACLELNLTQRDLLLDIAPSPQVTPLLAKLRARRTVRFDLGADNRLVDVIGSLTEVPLADSSVDVLLCYHVLEHIPDDRRAMREISRILSEDGVAVLQVPWRPGTTTDEDPDAPPEVRVARFGQIDHVRYYGIDFEDRLRDAGLSLRRVTPRELVGAEVCGWFKLVPDETVWLASRSAEPVVTAASDAAGGLALSFDALVRALSAQRQRADDAEAEAARLSKRVTRLQRRDSLRFQLGQLAPARLRRSDGRLARTLRRRVTQQRQR